MVMGRFENLIGFSVGNLKVISRAENIGKKVAWYCECECGNMSIVMSFNLKNGSTLSCGCLRKEMFLNRYDVVNDEYVIGYTNNDEVAFYFDYEDYEKIKNKVWHENTDGYLTTNLDNNKTISIQRFLMNPPNNLQVDHIDRNIKNNRKINLRICTNSVNAKNRGLYSSNKSGVAGVWFNEKSNKWTAYITVDGKRIGLGSFLDFEEAKEVRSIAEIKYFGKYMA